MQEAMITAVPRSENGTKACRRLRSRGMIPGVVYGHGQEVVKIAMNGHNLLQTLHTGSLVFDLKVEGLPDDKVLVKEVQYDSMGDNVIHVDLQRIALTETVEVTVPIVLTGHAIGSEHHGIVDQPLKELAVSCLPTQIPDEVRVTVTRLDIGDMVTVAELELPEGVRTTNAPEQVVVTVHPPVTEEEVEAAVEVAEAEAGEPEVIGAKPGEEAEEESSEE